MLEFSRAKMFQKQVKMVLEIKDTVHLRTQLVEAGGKLAVIGFLAKWSGPCKMIELKLEELSQEFTDVVFLKVDVDECHDIAAEFDITSKPTFVFMKRCRKMESFSEPNADKIRNTIQKLK